MAEVWDPGQPAILRRLNQVWTYAEYGIHRPARVVLVKKPIHVLATYRNARLLQLSEERLIFIDMT